MIDKMMDAVLNHDVQCPPSQTFGLSEIDAALRWDAKRMTEPASIRRKIIFDCGEYGGGSKNKDQWDRHNR